MLSCAAARAHARSLLELRVSPGADGDVPNVHVVVGDCRCCRGVFLCDGTVTDLRFQSSVQRK